MKPIAFLLLFVIAFGSSSLAQCVQGDCINGRGTYIYPSGAKYIGDFKNGEIHGIGVCYYTDGSKYSGEWKHRYPDGRGTKTYPDGTKRTGLWRRGKPVDEHGNILEEYIAKKKEELQDDGTNIQSGCLKGDCKNGYGIFAYPDGSKYEGEFSNGKFNGRGTFYFPDSSQYTGEFKDNYPHGYGTRTYANGKKETGQWREGEFIGSGMIEADRLGCIEGDCENGKGTYIYREGSAKYVGEFVNGQPHGFGTCLYANGDYYRGEWAEGAYSGKGTLYLKDGTEVTGYWRSGEYIGKQPPAETKPVVALPAPNPPVITQVKVWALVVGVAAYDHMPALRYTDDDAYRFYAFLKVYEGGALPDEQLRILIDEDATRHNILGTLQEILDLSGQNDLVIFYFSGHGLNGSFLPIDFDGYNNKVGHDEIAALFNKSKARYK